MSGHIVPAIVISILGIWCALSIAYRYFTSVKFSSLNTCSQSYVNEVCPRPFNWKLPIASIIVMCGILVADFLTCWVGTKGFTEALDPMNYQHVTMFTMFLLYLFVGGYQWLVSREESNLKVLVWFNPVLINDLEL